MEVEFRRTGERRYAVTIHREGLPALDLGGPGVGPLMPHDLQHLIVEGELELERGIFGFIAAGGQAGGAPHLAAGENKREANRRRARAAPRDERMLRRGARHAGDGSERAAYVCWYEWLRRSHDQLRRARAAAMADNVMAMLSTMPAIERTALTEELFARVCARMDALSREWSRLRVGDSFSVAWTVRPRHRSRAPR